MSIYELNVSRDGIVNSLKAQFTDQYTFLGEALQNGRRAGASDVQFVLDEAQMTLDIIDDGEGISDIERLLTLGESGWDIETVNAEYPYGVGFASLLMAADAIAIATQDKAMQFFTDDLLNFVPVSVVRCAPRNGTHIRLWLKPEYRTAGIVYAIKQRAAGFPLPVTLNGEELERPAALDASHRRFIDTPIGRVSLLPSQLPRDAPKDSYVRAFVQGLPVEFGYSPDFFDDCIIIHFASHVRARMPDRDKLLDEPTVQSQWNKIKKQLFADQLRVIKAHVPALTFADEYWLSCADWAPELLRDVPLAPSMLSRVEAIGPQLPDWHWQHEEVYTRWPSHAPRPTRNTLMLSGSFDAVDNQAANLYAIKANLPLVANRLPNSHWAAQKTFDAADLPIKFCIIGEEKKATYKGNCIWVSVCFCEAIELSLDDTLLNDYCPEDQAFLREHILPIVVDDFVFYDEDTGTLYVPDKADYLDVAAGLCSSFVSGESEEYMEYDFDHDRDGLADFILNVRCGDPAKIIQSQINRIKIDSNLMSADDAFILQWDSESNQFIVCTQDKKAA